MSKDVAIELLEKKIDALNKQAWDVRVYDSLKSMALSNESVELAKSINYHSGLAHGLKSLGFCLLRTANNNEALPLLQEALTLFGSLHDLKGEAVVIGYLGILQRNCGNFGEALELLFKALERSEQTAFTENAGTDHYQIGVTYKYLGNFEKALDSLYKSLSIFRELNNRLLQSYPINVIGSIYFENEDYTQALKYYQEGLMLRQESQDKLGESGSLDNIGFTHFKLNIHREAIYYCTESLVISERTGDKRSQANAMHHLAEIYKKTGNAVLATKFSNDSLQIRKQIGDKRGETEILIFLASLQETSGNNSEVFNWLDKALNISKEIKGIDLLSKTYFALCEYYKQGGRFEEAIEQLELHILLEKELHKNNVNQKIHNLEISHNAEEAKKEADTIRLRNKELNDLNVEIREQKEKLEITLADLKATQAQLIQSEKMASLGELTAGIAHEIQNPLNFVNNFSEVSNELIGELVDEVDKGNTREVKVLAKDVKQNLEKILHHGKRADSIVKGMLQHSRRSSSAAKEPTDINKLADEYLRLSYHGLRAKDKTFNADYKSGPDDGIGMIDVVPQDIGRVLLNLFNNAFYSVAEKKKRGIEGYKPEVTLTTQRKENGVLIRVRDNGLGIPKAVLDKIYQPFFTTKPTGEGTGLGLSMSYDIITKGHGGTLEARTKESEYAEFDILLPAKPTTP